MKSVYPGKEKSGAVVPGGRTLYGRKISAERFDAVFNLILGLSMVLRTEILGRLLLLMFCDKKLA